MAAAQGMGGRGPAQERSMRIAQNLRLMRELREVLAALGGADIAALALKGAALQGTVYAIDERVMLDVDVLVKPAQAAAAGAILAGLGLQAMRTPGRPLGTRLAHAQGFAHGAGVQIDLHQALAPPLRWRIDTAALFERALPCEFDGFVGLRLGNEDLLLHLALNLSKDQLAQSARCVEDIHRVLTTLTPDWTVLLQRAGRWGCRTALWLALELTHRRRPGAVPASVLAALAPGRLRRRWLLQVVDLDAEPPLRHPGRGRRLAQAAFVPVLSDRPLDGVLAAGRFALIRSADAVLATVTGAASGTD